MRKKEVVCVLLLGFIFATAGVYATTNVTMETLEGGLSRINITDADDLYSYEVNLDFGGSISDVDNYKFLGASDTSYGYSTRSGVLSVYGSKLGSVAGTSGDGNLFNVSYSGSVTLRSALFIDSVGSEEYIYYGSASGLAVISPVLTSESGNRKTTEDLYCSAVLFSDEGNVMNVTARWIKDGSTEEEIEYNSDYSSGGSFEAILDSANITKGETWNCSLQLRDGSTTSEWLNIGELEVQNSVPVVVLDSPADLYSTTNRTPIFNWSASDDDSDSLSYEFNISLVSAGTCVDERPVYSVSVAEYTMGSVLNCFDDNNYTWSVRANDGEEYGSWTTARTITIQSLVGISLPNDVINFGTLAVQGSNDTSDDSPSPLVVQNDGNAKLNISISAGDLWSSVSNPTHYYNYKIDSVEGYSSAFDSVITDTSWTNMPSSTTNAITELDYLSNANRAEIDIYLAVPPTESSDVRNSTISFVSSLGE